MKKLLVLILFSLFIFIGSTNSEDYTGTAQVMVSVATFFEVNVDRQLIDFNQMKPGETKEYAPNDEGVKVSCKSNTGNPWFLKIHDEQDLTDGNNYIPNSNFFWYGNKGSNASGIWHGNGRDNFTTEPVQAYSAGADEYNNLPDGTDLFFKFKLQIPQKQPKGVYKTAIVFTLTE